MTLLAAHSIDISFNSSCELGCRVPIVIWSSARNGTVCVRMAYRHFLGCLEGYHHLRYRLASV